MEYEYGTLDKMGVDMKLASGVFNAALLRSQHHHHHHQYHQYQSHQAQPGYLNVNGGGFLVRDGRRMVVETDVERYSRLLWEFKELHAGLNRKSSQKTPDELSNNNNKNNNDDQSQEKGGEEHEQKSHGGLEGGDPVDLMRHVEYMLAQLSQIGQDGRVSGSVGSQGSPVSASGTNTTVQTLLKELDKTLSSTPSMSASKPFEPSKPSKSLESSGTNKDSEKAIYELYYAPTTSASSASPSTMKDTNTLLSSISERISSLESVLGTPDIVKHHGAAGVPTSLISAVERLERDLGLILSTSSTGGSSTDDNGRGSLLEGISAKCRLVSADIDTMLNKRYDISNTPDATSSGVLNAASSGIDGEVVKKVNGMYETLRELPSLTSALPSVLSRLTALKSLHIDAANFSQSLSSLSKEQVALEEGVKHLEEVCAVLEGSMKRNEAVLAANLQVLGQNKA